MSTLGWESEFHPMSVSPASSNSRSCLRVGVQSEWETPTLTPSAKTVFPTAIKTLSLSKCEQTTAAHV